MRTFISLIASLVGLSACASAPSPQREAFETRLAELALDDAFEGRGGLALAVVERGDPVIARGFGYANAAERRPMTSDTPVNFASVSKSVSAWLFVHFLEQRDIALDAPVTSTSRVYVPPESAFEFDAVTFARVLGHTAGLSMPSAPIIPADEPLPPTIEVLRGYGDDAPLRLIRRPGERWDYSGGGYLLAQAVLEDLSGVAFADYADETLFEPLGMTDASFRLEGSIRDRAAVGHADGQPVDPYHLPGPAGGLYASIEDFARFMALYAPQNGALRRRLVSEAAFARMTRAAAQVELGDGPVEGAFYGLGHGVHTASDGEKFVYHSGGNPGVVAYFIVSLSSGDGFAVVCTGDDCIPTLSELIGLWGEAYDAELPPLY